MSCDMSIFSDPKCTLSTSLRTHDPTFTPPIPSYNVNTLPSPEGKSNSSCCVFTNT
jgi:hypothetical protein